MTTLTPRVQIAAMLLQSLYANPKNIIDHHRARNCALKEADALLAECGEGEANDCKYCEQTLRQEERATEWADKLANEIASKLHVDIGEHSSSNCPWENALEAIEDYEPTQPRKVEVTDDVPYDNALNEAAWAFNDYCTTERIEIPAHLWNNLKTAIRVAIRKRNECINGADQ